MDTEILISLISEGLTHTQIAEKLSIPKSTLQYRLEKLKLKTKLAEPGRSCSICNKELSGRQQKFCSKKCKTKHFQKDVNLYIKNRRWDLKDKIIELKGGKCILCGYSKSRNALQFHHRDPSLKKFELSCSTILNYKFETILEEMEKCDLVCANCHAEIHGDIICEPLH